MPIMESSYEVRSNFSNKFFTSNNARWTYILAHQQYHNSAISTKTWRTKHWHTKRQLFTFAKDPHIVMQASRQTYKTRNEMFIYKKRLPINHYLILSNHVDHLIVYVVNSLWNDESYRFNSFGRGVGRSRASWLLEVSYG